MSSDDDMDSLNDSVPPLTADESISDCSNGSASKKDSKSLYQYTDYGSVENDIQGCDFSTTALVCGDKQASSESPQSIRAQKFPVKLYAILSRSEFHHIIAWQPHGRSWKVHKPSLFENLVMPLYFEYSNYHSFNRLVNAWSFRRVSNGPDRGSYYHELFLRGKPQLQKFMRRLPKTEKKMPMHKNSEPDFYALDKKNPLPPLEDHPRPYAERFLFGPPPLTPFVQQPIEPPVVSPPLPGFCLGTSGTQPLAYELLAVFEDSQGFGDSTGSFSHLSFNSSQQFVDPNFTYAGRGVVAGSTLTSPIESWTWMQNQGLQQRQQQQLALHEQQQHMHQLQQLRSSSFYDFGAAFEPQDRNYIPLP